ncbi:MULTISPECIES: hypothetical protein [unclassified Moorena]|uniref:hypothetical protein n=1 Tax=unclassified Moorena TaxID=2683338 RepID=UPI0013BD7900|nr:MULTISPECIES: hypothetical protein [unclassified Moorena]NEP34562.1 hypothetical protein [Moorena sp. SIO3B2]NER85515.1 hypothetical protein [Moorena sp. SIO3A2]NES46368.1 hypothetical protein [Moorena sp. SIO2C4]
MNVPIAIVLGMTFTLVSFLPGTNQGIALADTQGKPNILVIMGDDIGWTNISAFEKGIVLVHVGWAVHQTDNEACKARW